MMVRDTDLQHLMDQTVGVHRALESKKPKMNSLDFFSTANFLNPQENIVQYNLMYLYTRPTVRIDQSA